MRSGEQKFDWGQLVRVSATAPPAYRPGRRAWIVGIRKESAAQATEPLGPRLYTIEYEDGSSLEIGEPLLEQIDESQGSTDLPER